MGSANGLGEVPPNPAGSSSWAWEQGPCVLWGWLLVVATAATPPLVASLRALRPSGSSRLPQTLA